MNLRKHFAFLFVFACLLVVAGCGNGEQTPSPGEDVTHGKVANPPTEEAGKTAH